MRNIVTFRDRLASSSDGLANVLTGRGISRPVAGESADRVGRFQNVPRSSGHLFGTVAHLIWDQRVAATLSAIWLGSFRSANIG